MSIDNTLARWVCDCTGQSSEGRALELHVLNGDHQQVMDTLILGAFHGDEPESEVLTRHFMEAVDIQRIGQRVVGVVPVVNPDGLSKGQRVTSNLVDLNRNFPTQDWLECGQDTIYYSGPKPASEPESQFIISILEKWQPRKIISIHTPYDVINYDGPALELAQAMSQVNGMPVKDDIGYATPGSFGTYTGKERNIATITLELPENDAFTPLVLQNNIQALFAAIQFDLP